MYFGGKFAYFVNLLWNLIVIPAHTIEYLGMCLTTNALCKQNGWDLIRKIRLTTNQAGVDSEVRK